jgi:hypothetical protein
VWRTVNAEREADFLRRHIALAVVGPVEIQASWSKLELQPQCPSGLGTYFGVCALASST